LFEHGGWLVPYADPDMGQYITDVFAKIDALLLGRKTYEIFAAHWPRVTDLENHIAVALNTMPKHVVSSSVPTVERDARSMGPLRQTCRRTGKL